MATTKAEQAAGFDFAAWIGAASRPERVVTLFAANNVQAEISRLEREYDDLLAGEGSGSWGDPGAAVDSPAAKRIEKELDQARKRLAASGQEFRVRALDSDDQDAINRAHVIPKDASDEERNRIINDRFMAQLAIQVVEPRTFTVEELTQLRKAIGEPEFLKLFEAAMETMSENSASSPFWRGSFGSSRS